jgi:hypothetical protein
VTELLLITDVDRLRTIFSRLTDDKKIRLRVATSLEKGSEELAAEKPAFVFLQTHLSGLSADILLMHLKKQLGRKRTRFILLATPEQAGDDIARLYQGHIDTALDDDMMLESIKALVAPPKAKKSPAAATPTAATPTVAVPKMEPLFIEQPIIAQPIAQPVPPPVEPEPVEPEPVEPEPVEPEPVEPEPVEPEPVEPEPVEPAPVEPASVEPAPVEVTAPAIASVPDNTQAEPSLDEQGLTYAPNRSRLSVYSEFNSSFDTAVSSMPPAEPLAHMPTLHDGNWDHSDVEVVKNESVRSKQATFLLWLAPVIIAVVVVTMLQHKRAQPVSVAIKPDTKSPATSAAVAAPQAKPAIATPAPALPPAPPAAPAAAAPKAGSVVLPATIPATPAPKPAVAADAKLSDKAVLAAIAENRGIKDNPGTRPTTLPDFIPRSGHDKSYGTANPGWERYKGQVTEFKVFREGGPIRAIQIVDRGGKGIPESFMRGVLTQVSNKSAFTKDTSEKKDGYEIQRGRIAENLSVVMYRDEQGGRLRAFVLTWK